jgi:hypothetical protein
MILITEIGQEMHREVRASLTSVSDLSLRVSRGRLSERGGQVCHEHLAFKQLGEEKLRLKSTLELKFQTLKYVTAAQ